MIQITNSIPVILSDFMKRRAEESISWVFTQQIVAYLRVLVKKLKASAYLLDSWLTSYDQIICQGYKYTSNNDIESYVLAEKNES